MLSKVDLAREDKVLERLATQFPKCLACGPNEIPKRCDSKSCDSSLKCDIAIRESLHVCLYTACRHFDHELEALKWIGNAEHQQRHESAHKQLSTQFSTINQNYAAQIDRLLTIDAIKEWGDDLNAHMRTLDAEMRTLWTKRESTSS